MRDPRFPELDEDGVKKAVERLSAAMDVKSYPPGRANASVSISLDDLAAVLVADGTWTNLGAHKGASLKDVIGRLLRARGSALERSVTKIVAQCATVEGDDVVVEVDGAMRAVAHLKSMGAPTARVCVLIEILTAALALIEGTVVAKAQDEAPETPLRALYRTYGGGRYAHYLTVENALVLEILAKGLDPLFGILAEAVRSPDARSELGDVIAAVEDAIRHCTAP